MWLSIVGALSLAVIALAAFCVYQIRLERRRSDARVAALAAAIDDPRWRVDDDAAPVDDEDNQDAVAAAPPVVSLVVPDVERPSRAPAFAIAALVIMGAVTLFALGLNSGNRTPRPAAVVHASSIELLSMRHAMDGGTLIVSGLVRNPTATATPALSAVISVFGRDGRIVARGESHLDALVLEPGKETTFRVSVSEVDDPGRYRLAFVNGSQIVPHVDRRSDLSRTALANDARGN
jgi:hypothetical protein